MVSPIPLGRNSASAVIDNTIAPGIQDNVIRDFYLGLFLAISSSVFIGSSFIFKKKALIRLANNGIRAGDGGFGYLLDWVWWSGMLLMAGGEVLNFTAYAFSPATLVTPLGALSVLVSAVLSSRFLQEYLNLAGKLGCLVCVTGSIMIVLHSPKEQEVKSMEDLAVKLRDTGFLLYTLLVCLSTGILIFHFAPRIGQKNPLVYITITGSVGSLSVMWCKAFGVAIKETISGRNQFSHWLTWFIILLLVVCITLQMNYLNKALDVFNTGVVTPLLYVLFTTFVIIASAILFKEWMNLAPENILGILSGFVTVLVGIFLLHGFKDLPLSLDTLNVSVLRQQQQQQQSSNSSNLMMSPLSWPNNNSIFHNIPHDTSTRRNSSEVPQTKVISWRRGDKTSSGVGAAGSGVEEERQLIASSSDSETEMYAQRNGR